MRNYSSSFLRTDEISREPKKSAHWLESFAEKMAIQEQAQKSQPQVKTASKTAVEVARHRNEAQPSIYEMMSAIVSGQKPKFSSVEEAVKDYQERTGLSAFQRRNSMIDFAEQIVNAGECGDDEEDCGEKPTTQPAQMFTGNDYDNRSDTNFSDAPDLHRHVETEDDSLGNAEKLHELAKVIQMRRNEDDDPDPGGGSASLGTELQDDTDFDVAADNDANDKQSTCPPGVPLCSADDGKKASALDSILRPFLRRADDVALRRFLKAIGVTSFTFPKPDYIVCVVTDQAVESITNSINSSKNLIPSNIHTIELRGTSGSRNIVYDTSGVYVKKKV
jgi:hypothetical protein